MSHPHQDLLAQNRDNWLAYMLWDQGYVSQEKAAELSSGLDLAEFRQFCAGLEDE